MAIEPASFSTFMMRIRAGDAAAAEELVRHYEPAIRVIVRAHLGSTMRRELDSLDICQSVLGTFFARAGLGQFELDDPKQLLALLVKIARNKLNSQARYQQRDCRTTARRADADALEAVAEATAPPDRIVAARETLAELRARLSPEERVLAERRLEGQDWASIAADLGGTAEGRRKQLARAIDRLAPALGLVEVDDDDQP